MEEYNNMTYPIVVHFDPENLEAMVPDELYDAAENIANFDIPLLTEEVKDGMRNDFFINAIANAIRMFCVNNPESMKKIICALAKSEEYKEAFQTAFLRGCLE